MVRVIDNFRVGVKFRQRFSFKEVDLFKKFERFCEMWRVLCLGEIKL